MSRREQVRSLVEQVIEALGNDASAVALCGAAVPALYPSPHGVDIRMTLDVDCLIDVQLPEYYALRKRLVGRGFRERNVEGAPLCRLWLETEPEVAVDLMPVDARVLGFSNPWYREALQDAEWVTLPSGNRVRAIRPVHFLATKLVAFDDRGRGDYLASHDLEDVLALLGARPDLFDKVTLATSPAGRYVRETLLRLASDDDFLAAVPGSFPPDETSQSDADEVVRRLMALRQAR